jgi:hypothetical protein
MHHCKSVYNSVVLIRHLSQSVKLQIKAVSAGKTLSLGGPNSHNHLRKTLFIDLDETLIRCEPSPREGLTEQAVIGNTTMWFCVRPYAYDLLVRMAGIF